MGIEVEEEEKDEDGYAACGEINEETFLKKKYIYIRIPCGECRIYTFQKNISMSPNKQEVKYVPSPGDMIGEDLSSISRFEKKKD
jgi:hypothetical protein